MKIAIVTGASSGMGREFVRQLHSYIRPDEIWAIARRKAALEELAQESPLGRNGKAEDIAQAMEYLANADFITGEVLSVNGGLII